MTAASASLPGTAVAPTAHGASAAIETEALTKRYGRARGVDDVSLTVRHGEVLGFLGPNGAGKTTAIRVLLGLLRPTGGRARILGHDTQRDGVAARRTTGYLPGDFAVEDSVTGAELLDLLAALRGAGDRAGASALAHRLGADLHRPFGELSRGNRQKVGLVQALVHRPPVLILDEPTSGLDPLVQETFVELVGEARASGAAVLLSSHNLAEVERLCDRVAVLREGRLVAVETVAAMRARAVRNVVVRFEGQVPEEELRRLPGVAGLRRAGSELRFTVSGELTPLLRATGRHRVLDMEIARPTLEEAFVAAYGDGSPS